MDMKVDNDGKRARFSLHGPEEDFDPRVTAYRSDLADIALAGKLFAPHYSVPVPMRCTARQAMIRKQGGANYQAISELLFGEEFHILDVAGDWAWGFCTHDNYVGYVPVSALQPVTGLEAASHVVTARSALVFAEPDILAVATTSLPARAMIIGQGLGECGQFLKTEAGFVHVKHVAEVGDTSDYVALAEKMIGAPYLWGGRSGDGIDCSGLVQISLAAAGLPMPRDSDQQMDALDQDIPDDAELQRGDLVFFPGHVGIMVDGENMIHANSHWMQVIAEPLADVIARFAADHDQPVLARKRPT